MALVRAFSVANAMVLKDIAGPRKQYARLVLTISRIDGGRHLETVVNIQYSPRIKMSSDLDLTISSPSWSLRLIRNALTYKNAIELGDTPFHSLPSHFNIMRYQIF